MFLWLHVACCTKRCTKHRGQHILHNVSKFRDCEHDNKYLRLIWLATTPGQMWNFKMAAILYFTSVFFWKTNHTWKHLHLSTV